MAALSLVPATPANAQTRQIVQNGGFESSVDGWVVNQGYLRHTTAVVRTGSGAAEMTIHPEWDASHIVQCANVSAIIKTWPAPDGTKHLNLSGYVNTNADTASLIRIEARFYSGTDCGESLNWYVAPAIAGPTNGWVRISGTTEISSRTKSIGIYLYAEGSGGEIIYWDDVEAYSDDDSGMSYAEETEKLAPTVLPICAVAAAFGVFGLLWLMRRNRH